MQANEAPQAGLRERYQHRTLEIRRAYDAGSSGQASGQGSGQATVLARSELVDAVVRELWETASGPGVAGVALVAVGGYGRRELFPFSDVDLLFLLDGKANEKMLKEPIRRMSQGMWDLGVRLSPATRKLTECGRFDPELPEFTLSLLDQRFVAGDEAVQRRLAGETLARLKQREQASLLAALVSLTRQRHGRYGETIFHLEPNIKECPGGLRDINVCEWITALRHTSGAVEGQAGQEFRDAVEFLWRLRCFLHYRHERDDNTLDWQTQDMAAAAGVGLLGQSGGARHTEAAYWMRVYFRHARSVERRLTQVLHGVVATHKVPGRLRSLTLRRPVEPVRHGYRVEQGLVILEAVPGAGEESIDPAQDPDVVLHLMVELAERGAALDPASEARISRALPLLSSHLEEGAALWLPLRTILKGRYAGKSLRTMHAMGLLELLIPEFHGIDALVIRDAYHRYTVDEHTFVVIDTLHAVELPGAGPMAEWTAKFSAMLRDVAHPELLYLGALLHDTGKGRSSGAHAHESVQLARAVLARLELDAYETGLVLAMIENHLEMSAALRRDIFDAATVRGFAARATTPDALRMLTLFTYADINAVHPDALTPWKAENLWRLYMATANFLDRSVDEERVSATAEEELVHRVAALLPTQRSAVGDFLEGLPKRYLRTRTPEQVRTHYEMAARLVEDPVQLDFHYAVGVSEITLVMRDRPLLFATMAGALAAWGMNIVTADAFANRQGVVIDSLRFTDGFRTLELNVSERERFARSVRDVLSGAVAIEKLLNGRRGARTKAPRLTVLPRVEFDDAASASSTLVQVVAQDAPGLLRGLSLALAEQGCNIEVALVDTEGDMAIDVFYVSKEGRKLSAGEEQMLRPALWKTIGGVETALETVAEEVASPSIAAVNTTGS